MPDSTLAGTVNAIVSGIAVLGGTWAVVSARRAAARVERKAEERQRKVDRDIKRVAREAKIAKAAFEIAANDARLAKEVSQQTHVLVDGQHSLDMEFKGQLLKLLADNGIIPPPEPRPEEGGAAMARMRLARSRGR